MTVLYLIHTTGFEQWIQVRLQRGWGVSFRFEYRGLRSDLHLVITNKWQAYELTTKHCDLKSGPEVFLAGVLLQQTISRFYRQAEILSSPARTVDGAPLLSAPGGDW